MVEAGDIPAGEDSVWRCFANDQNKNLTDWSKVNGPVIPGVRILQTDPWRAGDEPTEEPRIPVGDSPSIGKPINALAKSG